MKMIPHVPVKKTDSRAEERVHSLLSVTQIDGAVGMHSLRLHRHRQKVSSEADFVIVTPEAVVVLEVKGGRVRQAAGKWISIDRDDGEHDIGAGPFVQGETAMYALRDRLTELVGKPTVDAFPFAFGVVTPDCLLATASVEWGSEIVWDEASFRGASDLYKPLQQLVAYWRQRRDVSSHLRASEDEIRAVVAACRPDFEALPSLGARALTISHDAHRATEDQYRVLDLIGSFDRLAVEGGAGTGKTLLAAEFARRAAEAGDRVLLTCHSPMLAGWLRSSLPDAVQVVTHSSLSTVDEQVDLLIVDEAQDLMKAEALDALDGVVRGGLDDGRWLILSDPQHQAGVAGEFDPTVYELMTDRAAGRPVPLRTNVRNTAPVLGETHLLTGARVEQAQVQGGGPVLTRFVDSPADEAQLIRSWLKEFRREDVDDGSVTILTPSKNPALLDLLPATDRARIQVLGASASSAWPIGKVSLASISDFKGMENDVIVLADLHELDLEARRDLIYVAMTRARAELRIIAPQKSGPIMERLRLENAE